jgi:hypothetical protein
MMVMGAIFQATRGLLTSRKAVVAALTGSLVDLTCMRWLQQVAVRRLLCAPLTVGTLRLPPAGRGTTAVGLRAHP